jgi:hypothetical protein
MPVIELLSKVLAKQNGWSRVYAEGYAAGETLRRQGQTLSSYGMVGIDEWALGFRAGYFERERQSPDSARAPGTREMAQKHRSSNWSHT